MSTYQQVLELISRGTAIPQVADRMDMRQDAVLAMIESMVRSGHLQDLDCADDTCSACPMADGCPVPQDGPSQYFVTEDGRALLRDADGTVEKHSATSPSVGLSKT